jgi:hypothetical protein
MLGERDALGAMLGAGGMGQGIGPRPRAAAHVAIKMLGHPYAQEPAALWPGSRKKRGPLPA